MGHFHVLISWMLSWEIYRGGGVEKGSLGLYGGPIRAGTHRFLCIQWYKYTVNTGVIRGIPVVMMNHVGGAPCINRQQLTDHRAGPPGLHH